MQYKLLQRAAASSGALILRDDPDIQAFDVLLSKGLIAGLLHRPEGQPMYAVIHCVTPDGRALLSLTEFVARARLKALPEN